MNIQYFTEINLPSTRICKIPELYNDNYIKLQKFILGESYEYFFKGLDSMLMELNADFKDFLLIDKYYAYISILYYNVKATTSIANNIFGRIDIPLGVILDNIEESFVNHEKELIIGNFNIIIDQPRYLYYDNGIIGIDASSSISKIYSPQLKNYVPLTNDNRLSFTKDINSKTYNAIYNNLANLFSKEIEIFKYKEFKSSISISPYDKNFPILIVNLFKESMENIYSLIFNFTHHIKMQYSDYLRLTPIESYIMLNKYISQQEEINKKGN